MSKHRNPCKSVPDPFNPCPHTFNLSPNTFSLCPNNPQKHRNPCQSVSNPFNPCPNNPKTQNRNQLQKCFPLRHHLRLSARARLPYASYIVPSTALAV